MFKILICLILLAYAAICVFMYSKQAKLLYFPQVEDQEYSKQVKSLEIEFRNENVRLHGWANIQNVSPQNPLIIYYGGNGGEASRNISLMARLKQENFLLVNYRGYGRSEGKPAEQDLKSDALFIFDRVIKDYGINGKSVILFGRSLGSGIATYVASERQVSKVVLVTPYDSIVNVAKKQFWFLPVSLLMHQRFESNSLAPSIDEPMLCFIAEQDVVVPPQHAHELCDVWKGEVHKQVLKGAGHNDISEHVDFVAAIQKFLN